METLSQPSYNEVMTNLSSKLINIKASIYTSLFGEAPLKEPVDSLIFGYFVGSLSQKLNMKFTEDKLKQLFTIYKDNAKTTKDLDTLLKKTTDDFCATFYDLFCIYIIQRYLIFDIFNSIYCMGSFN